MFNFLASNARETRIFMPFGESFSGDAWAEQILGDVIAPFVSRYGDQLEWFWFSRYFCPREMDSGSCDVSNLPAECLDKNNWHRSLRFRFEIKSDANQAEIEGAFKETVQTARCVITDIRDYPAVGDLASTRFASDGFSDDRKMQRAKCITNLYNAISLVVLDCLVRNEHGRYTIENCPHPFNYAGTIFESVHHLFCNMTGVKTVVSIFEKDGDRIAVGPMQSTEGWNLERHFQVLF